MRQKDYEQQLVKMAAGRGMRRFLSVLFSVLLFAAGIPLSIPSAFLPASRVWAAETAGAEAEAEIIDFSDPENTAESSPSDGENSISGAEERESISGNEVSEETGSETIPSGAGDVTGEAASEEAASGEAGSVESASGEAASEEPVSGETEAGETTPPVSEEPSSGSDEDARPDEDVTGRSGQSPAEPEEERVEESSRENSGDPADKTEESAQRGSVITEPGQQESVSAESKNEQNDLNDLADPDSVDEQESEGTPLSLSQTAVTLTAGTRITVQRITGTGLDEESIQAAVSSGTAVATVSVSGDSITITGKTPGSATITVTGDRGTVCTIEVTVKAPPFTLSQTSVTVSAYKTYSVTASGSDISTVTSSNTNILKVRKYSARTILIIPVRAGKATIVAKNAYGVTAKTAVTIDEKYIKTLLTRKTAPGKTVYGSTVLTGKTAPGAAVSVKAGGKTCTAKASDSGAYSIKNVPVVRIGTKMNLVFGLSGQRLTKTVTVVKSASSVYTPNYTYWNTQKVRVQAAAVHAGDKIQISFNGKKYSYTFAKGAKTANVVVSIQKPGRYGIKMATKLLNKFNQQLASCTEYIYFSDTVHLGDTKAKVKWLTGWNDPVRINHYAKSERWCYDWDEDGVPESFLHFDKSGKVFYWWVGE